MSEETKSATDTLVKKSATVVVGERTIVVNTFVFARTVRVFQLLSELAQAAGIEKVLDTPDSAPVVGGTDDNVSEPLELTPVSSFFARVVAAIPRLLSEGVPVVYKLLGVIVVGNKELRRLEEQDGVDVDQALYDLGKDIAYEGTVEEVMNLVSVAAGVMGIETVIKAAAPLLRTLVK